MFGIKDKTIDVGIKIAIFIVVLGVLHLTAGRWVFKGLNKAKDEAEGVLEEKRKVEELIRAYPDPKKKIEEIYEEMEELKKKAVAEDEMPRIIQQLTKTSSDLNIEITSIRPIKEPPFKQEALPQGVTKAYIEVVCMVTYKTLGEYLEAIEGLATIFSIEGLEIVRSEVADKELSPLKTEEGGKIRATLLISSYTVWKL